MAPATEGREPRPLSAFLAGLQGGMLAAIAYLLWMGATAVWQRASFWAAGNLMASVFYGGASIRRGFAFSSLSGIALYLIVYSLLGALFALTFRARLPQLWLTLASIVFALCWYCLFFQVAAKWAAPLVWQLYPETSTLWGHVLYGAALSRYPRLLTGPSKDEAAPPETRSEGAAKENPNSSTPVPARSSSPPDPA